MTAAEAALAFLQGIRSDAAGELAETLWHTVLRGAVELPAEWVRRALDAREAGALWAAKAVTLAGLVLQDTAHDGMDNVASGGRS